jgi:hypothetical protein
MMIVLLPSAFLQRRLPYFVFLLAIRTGYASTYLIKLYWLKTSVSVPVATFMVGAFMFPYFPLADEA